MLLFPFEKAADKPTTIESSDTSGRGLFKLHPAYQARPRTLES
jgi:hypothetical protein